MLDMPWAIFVLPEKYPTCFHVSYVGHCFPKNHPSNDPIDYRNILWDSESGGIMPTLHSHLRIRTLTKATLAETLASERITWRGHGWHGRLQERIIEGPGSSELTIGCCGKISLNSRCWKWARLLQFLPWINTYRLRQSPFGQKDWKAPSTTCWFSGESSCVCVLVLHLKHTFGIQQCTLKARVFWNVQKISFWMHFSGQNLVMETHVGSIYSKWNIFFENRSPRILGRSKGNFWTHTTHPKLKREGE